MWILLVRSVENAGLLGILPDELPNVMESTVDVTVFVGFFLKISVVLFLGMFYGEIRSDDCKA